METSPPRVKDVCGVASGLLGRNSPSSTPWPRARLLCWRGIRFSLFVVASPDHPRLAVKVELEYAAAIHPRALPCPDPDDRKLDAMLTGTCSCSHSRPASMSQNSAELPLQTVVIDGPRPCPAKVFLSNNLGRTSKDGNNGTHTPGHGTH